MRGLYPPRRAWEACMRGLYPPWESLGGIKEGLYPPWEASRVYNGVYTHHGRLAGCTPWYIPTQGG